MADMPVPDDHSRLQLFIDHQAAKSAADTANSPSLSSASTSALLATPESSKCNTAKLRWKKALKAVDTLVAAQRALCDATVVSQIDCSSGK